MPKAPVSGRATYNGKPVRAGQIVFMNATGYPAVAELDGDGRYHLEAAIGENTVTVESRGPGIRLSKPSEHLGQEGPRPLVLGVHQHVARAP